MKYIKGMIVLVGNIFFLGLAIAGTDPIAWKLDQAFPSSVSVGETSSVTYTLTNTLPISLVNPLIVEYTAYPANEFTYLDQCTGQRLMANESCQVTISLTPKLAGEKYLQVTITGYDKNAVPLPFLVTNATSSGPVPPSSAILSVTPRNLQFTTNLTGSVAVTNDLSSPVPALNVAAIIPVGSNITVQSTTCGAVLAIGASCTITFTSAVAEGPTNINIKGNDTNTVDIGVTVIPPPTATISVSPGSLLFSVNSTGSVTVTNEPSSPVPALNVAATIPVGSNITVQSTTCGTSLAIGASCTINFTGSAVEGPTNISIKGSDTNTAVVGVTVTSTPIASVSVSPETLLFTINSAGTVTITNDQSSPIAANNIAVTIPVGSNISVQGTTCGAVLAIGASCTMTFTGTVAEGPTDISISGSNTNTTKVEITVTPTPIASLSVSPDSLEFTINASGSVTVTNDPSSPIPASNIVASIPLGSHITVQSTSCGSSLAIGASCTITFTGSSSEGPTTINISGSNSNTTEVDITVTPTPIATLSVNPSPLTFVVNSTGSVTVTNDTTSPVAANNIVATIPTSSNISVQSTTCGSSLGIGASCTITFTGTSSEESTSILISGSNTTVSNLSVTVTSQPLISITSPAESNRLVEVSGTSLLLQVTNNASSAVNANNITVTDKSACPNLVVNAANCTSVAPNASCNLELSSSSPYAPCVITISGTNTGNSPTTTIGFLYLGGIVFEQSNGTGKVVGIQATEFSSRWITALDPDVPGARSFTDGSSNTDAIVADSQCTANTSGCAAYQCRSIGSSWYLPARNELINVQSALCFDGTCFGNFMTNSYWSSTETFPNDQDAWYLNFPAGGNGATMDKLNDTWVRCTRAF